MLLYKILNIGNTVNKLNILVKYISKKNKRCSFDLDNLVACAFLSTYDHDYIPKLAAIFT